MNYTEAFSRIRQNIQKVMVGKDDCIDLILNAMICGGHVLIEDIPGLGKTTLVESLARSLGCSFRRIQFTPDVLPSDITGFTMYNLHTGEQEVHPGSIMSQIILADEINRTSPKTQSALLEAMQENQVTIDGKTYPLPQPFMVLATQNPIELVGTYPLPEAQLDRFLMRIRLGYPSQKEELQILERHRSSTSPAHLNPVLSAQHVLILQKAMEDIQCTPNLCRYIIEISEQTRNHPDVRLGVSPRGSIALMRTAMANAMLNGRDYVIPDDIQKMLIPVLAHRIVMRPRASSSNHSAEDVLKEIVRSLPVPGVS